MNSVISATTGAAYGVVPRVTRQESYLATARDLLDGALARQAEGAYDLALEDAYRAALRTAGAVVAGSDVVANRKRLPSSAWDKLALTGPSGKRWAATFRGYSRLRGRVASGIELRPDPATVESLIVAVQEFFSEVAGEGTDRIAA